MLCTKCTSIDFRPIEQNPPAVFDALEHNNYLESHLYSPHSPNVANLRMTAERGCHFCVMLCFGLFANAIEDYSILHTNSGESIILEIPVSARKVEPQVWLAQSEVVALYGKKSASFEGIPQLPGKNTNL